MLRPARFGVLFLALSLAACTNDVEQPTRPALADYVSGDAALALQPNGQFRLAGPLPGELQESAAEALAYAYVHTAGHWLKGTWDSERGSGSIDVDGLTTCGRAYLAHSPYAALPASASEVAHQRYGAKWLVTLCGRDGDPEVSVAIPVGDTSLHITKDHAIIGLGAGHVTSVGVPPSLEVPSSPEEAVRGVATATGDRVSAVPELILPPPRFVPQLAKWRITLTSNTRVKRTSDRTVLNTAILYFGFGGTWRTSGMFTGNSHLSTTRIVRDAGNGNATIALSMRDGYADVFELVTPEGQ